MTLNILYPPINMGVRVAQIVYMDYHEWPAYCGGTLWKGFRESRKTERNTETVYGWGKNGPIDTGEKLVKALVENCPATVAIADNMHGVLGKKFFDMLPDAPVKIGNSTYVVHKDVVYNSNSGHYCFNVMICRSVKK